MLIITVEASGIQCN